MTSLPSEPPTGEDIARLVPDDAAHRAAMEDALFRLRRLSRGEQADPSSQTY